MLRRLRGGAMEAAAVAAASAKAAQDLGVEAARGFFLPFCLTMTAVLARLHVSHRRHHPCAHHCCHHCSELQGSQPLGC